MKGLFLAIAVAAACAQSGAVLGAWGYPAYPVEVQSDRGRGGPPPGYERYERREPQREARRDRQDRRDHLNEDERRALHRDLDKANRELYRRRQK
jgi:hypothetical protein